jgi:tetratricopeptide (TPR) repeat protein
MHPAHLHPGQAGWPPLSVGLSLLALGGVAACAWLAVRREPAVAWGLLWFVIALTPTLGIVAQQGFQARADRFTYVPHIGLMVAIVWGAGAVAERLRAPAWLPTIVLVAAAVGCVAIDRQQIAVWKDSETLWRHVLSLEPDNPIASNNLGTAFYERGLVEESMPYFERALAIGESERSHVWLGLALADQGRPEEAIAHFRAGLALDPESVDAHTNLGAALAQLGRLAEALPHFEAAFRLDPHDLSARQNLARARATLGLPPDVR